MAGGQGWRNFGNFLQQAFTGAGAALGLARPYNPDDARFQAEQAAIALQMQQLEAQQTQARNRTILIVVGAIVGLVIIGGIGYAAYKE